MGSLDRTGATRFRDPFTYLGQLSGEILVHCPRCDGQASIRPEPEPEPGPPPVRGYAPRRLACVSCGFVDRWALPFPADSRHGLPLQFNRPKDPYFGIPLWLATDCLGHVLWAYNVEHLDLLEAYVSARLRERSTLTGPMSLVEQLPAWIKDGKHRSDVLSGIRRLRTMAAQGTGTRRSRR